MLECVFTLRAVWEENEIEIILSVNSSMRYGWEQSDNWLPMKGTAKN